MSFDKIFDLTAVVYFYFYNNITRLVYSLTNNSCLSYSNIFAPRRAQLASTFSRGADTRILFKVATDTFGTTSRVLLESLFAAAQGGSCD